MTQHHKPPASDGQINQSSVTAADVQKYIGGIHYPCDKDDLIELAIENNAPDDVIFVMEFFPNQEFDSPMQLAQYVGVHRR